MSVVVEFTVFESIHAPADIQRVRRAAAAMMQNVMSSGKLINGGFYADVRGGFMLLNVDSAEAVFDLVCPWLHDNCTLKVRPFMEIEKFPTLMQTIAARDVV